jgi:hypothetical protein
MKKILTILTVLAIGFSSYWLGKQNEKRNAFWTSFADSIGLARMLETNGGLSEKGKENLNKFSDIWLYGYFSEANPPSDEDLRERIESGLVAIIEWKQENGYAVGPQEPLVGLKPIEKAIPVDELEDELFTDPLVEHFNAYKKRFDQFIERRGIQIQPSELVNASSAASVELAP